jgi:soluble P-type ATPase
LIKEGALVYIISARRQKDGMLNTAKAIGIPESRIYATGSNKAKVEKVKELGIQSHYDNNPDVIKALGSVGKLFTNG